MRKHKTKIFLRTGIICLILVFLLFGASVYLKGKEYTEYTVLSSIQRSDTISTAYEEYNGNILKYSKDGISCVDTKNNAIWSHTYTMQEPILAICQKAVAVAEKKGTEVYVFDETGLKGEITTLLPVQQISVSSQGVAAVLVENSNSAEILLYDSAGTLLTESKFSLQDWGYPISMSISADGTKLAVSCIQILEGVVNSCVVFYNFGTVGENFSDHMVAAESYPETIIPKLQYMGSDTCVAVGDNKLYVYSGKEIPELSAETAIEKEIRSVFLNDHYIGLVYAGEGSENNEMEIFNTKGDSILKRQLGVKYQKIKFSGDYVIAYNESECAIYNMDGTEKFCGEIEGGITDVYTAKGFYKFVVLNASEMKEIRLK